MNIALMLSEKRFTRRPFTVAFCCACGGGRSRSELSTALQAVIARCAHGVLVETRCLLGRFACSRVRSDRGEMLLLQPCNTERVPISAAQLVGPIRTSDDVEVLCAWVAAGAWRPDLLPQHLRAADTMRASASTN